METLIIITNLILLLGDKDAELYCFHLVCNFASQNAPCILHGVHLVETCHG